MKMMTVREIAELFHVSLQTVYSWERKGIIKADLRTPTRRRFFSEEQVKRLLERGLEEGGNENVSGAN